MLHGVRLRNGRAEWYRNRWVRTRQLAGEPAQAEDGTRDLAVNAANTHVIEHAGRLLALVESGFPYQVTRELDTVGPCDFGGRLSTAMTAHPKADPATGELHFFGYAVRQPPYVTYHRLSAAGELVASIGVDVPGPTMMHDFAITERHVVWLDLPLAFDSSLLGKGMPFRWDDDYRARLGVMPLGGGPVHWFEIEPCYVFHVANAREDATGRIVLDAVRYDRAAWHAAWSRIGGTVTPGSAAAGGDSRLYRWTFDPHTGAVREDPVDDRGIEFPTLNETRVGRAHRYLYAAGDASLVRYDGLTGEVATHALGTGRRAGEPRFVPAAGGAEGDGWLLSLVTHAAGAELLILDATDVSGPPVATIRLPRRVPAGFHGSWIPDAPN